MKKNVDLTDKGHFSEGWMQGGFRAKGVFREKMPMKTSAKFKKILKMGTKVKKYGVSSLASKLFGVKMSNILSMGNSGVLTLNQQVDVGMWATTSTVTTNSAWFQTNTQ